MTLEPGSLFAARYEILRRIAEGGMGAVYEVRHLETGRRRALKVLHPHVLKDRKAREQFRREARIAAVIESEAVVDVFDAGIDDASGTPFLVMELLRGEDLAARVDRVRALPAAEVVGYLRRVSFALDKAHRVGVVHRDLKPENLFLHEREEGGVSLKILDFGVAKIVRDANQRNGDTLNVGTPMYMAPEQFTGLHPITGAVDRYALAHLAYVLLVGEPYFDPEAEQETAILRFMQRVVEGVRESPVARAAARRGVRLPSSFDAWFVRATATDPALRHQDAASLVDHLEIALGLSYGEAPTVAMVRPEIEAGRLSRAHSPAQESIPGPAFDVDALGPSDRRHDTISGTTTPHRPQRAAHPALWIGGTTVLSVALGVGLWLMVGRVEPSGSTGAAPVTSLAPGPRTTGTSAPAGDPAVVVEPAASATTTSSATSAEPTERSPADAAPAPALGAPSTSARPRRPPPRPGTSTSAAPSSPTHGTRPSPSVPPKYSRD